MHRWCYRNFTNVGKLKKLDEGRVRTLLPDLTCQLPSTRSTRRRSSLGYGDLSASRGLHLIGSAATWPTGHNTSESARRGHRHPSANTESRKVPSSGRSCSPFTSPQSLMLSRHSTLVTTSMLMTLSSTFHLTMTSLAILAI